MEFDNDDVLRFDPLTAVLTHVRPSAVLRAGEPDQPRDDDGKWTDGGGGGGGGSGGGKEGGSRKPQPANAARTPQEKRARVHRLKKETEAARTDLTKAAAKVPKAEQRAQQARDEAEAVREDDDIIDAIDRAETLEEQARDAKETAAALDRGETVEDENGDTIEPTDDNKAAAREEADKLTKEAREAAKAAGAAERKIDRAQSKEDRAEEALAAAEEDRDEAEQQLAAHEDHVELAKIAEAKPEQIDRLLQDKHRDAEAERDVSHTEFKSANAAYSEAKEAAQAEINQAWAKREREYEEAHAALIDDETVTSNDVLRRQRAADVEFRRKHSEIERRHDIARLKREREGSLRRLENSLERLGFWAAAVAGDGDDSRIFDDESFPEIFDRKGTAKDRDGDGRTGTAEEQDDKT